jgi:hypothetical protein
MVDPITPPATHSIAGGLVLAAADSFTLIAACAVAVWLVLVGGSCRGLLLQELGVVSCADLLVAFECFGADI